MPVYIPLLILLFALMRPSTSQSLIESLLNLLSEGQSQSNTEPRSRMQLLPEYDFIIVGAGTAGCTLARRLTENPDWTVLLVEAGRHENYLMDIPILANYLQFTDANWKYTTEPSQTSCLGLDNNQCNWPRGKVMGGSSVLNYMIHTRGNPKDYDNWAKMGNPGWSYEEILPYFKKLESFNIPGHFNSSLHGHNGPVTISHAPFRTGIATAIIDAAQELGEPIVDYNGATQVGYAYLQLHLINGTRASASRSYLHPVSSRENLHIRKYTEVDKILIEPLTKRAYGIQFKSFGQVQKIRAKKEVIVSAGAINSPKLLMYSGVGPKEILTPLGINVVNDLPVGKNLMDHISMGGLMFLIDKPFSLITEKILDNSSTLIDYFTYHNGPMSIAGGCEVLAFLDLKDKPDGHPNMELLFVSGSLVSDLTLRRNFGIRDDIFDEVYQPIMGRDTFMVFPMLLLPKSKGEIRLRNTDPESKPLIYSNYLAHKQDMDTIIKGVYKTIELVEKTAAMKKIGARLYRAPLPACKRFKFATRKYFECQTRQFTFNIYHYSGTCKMGANGDTTAVVDARLKVHGIKGLRVIDASIMPEIPAAHTNAPTYMIAEKGADLIKEDWGFV